MFTLAKKNRGTGILLAILLLAMGSVFGQKMSREEVVKTFNEFQKLLKQEAKAKNPEALQFLKQAQANKGKLTVSVQDMQKLITKWSAKPEEGNEPKKQETKPIVEPKQEVKPSERELLVQKFHKALTARISANDDSAKKIKAEVDGNGGKPPYPASKLEEFIEDWLVAERMEGRDINF